VRLEHLLSGETFSLTCYDLLYGYKDRDKNNWVKHQGCAFKKDMKISFLISFLCGPSGSHGFILFFYSLLKGYFGITGYKRLYLAWGDIKKKSVCIIDKPS